MDSYSTSFQETGSHEKNIRDSVISDDDNKEEEFMIDLQNQFAIKTKKAELIWEEEEIFKFRDLEFSKKLSNGYIWWFVMPIKLVNNLIFTLEMFKNFIGRKEAPTPEDYRQLHIQEQFRMKNIHQFPKVEEKGTSSLGSALFFLDRDKVFAIEIEPSSCDNTLEVIIHRFHIEYPFQFSFSINDLENVIQAIKHIATKFNMSH
jgi:hypothetical protein